MTDLIVALEEHYWIADLRDRYGGARGVNTHTPARQLDDLGAIRLKDMDEAGITVSGAYYDDIRRANASPISASSGASPTGRRSRTATRIACCGSRG
jgi:hypothetical protein